MNWQAVYPSSRRSPLAGDGLRRRPGRPVGPGKDRHRHLLPGAGVARRCWRCGQLWYFYEGATYYAMQRMVVADPMGHLLGLFATLAMMTTLVYARPYAAARDMLKGELFTLSMFSLLGILVMLRGQQLPGRLPRPRADVALRSTRWSRCAATTPARPRRR